MKDPYLRDLGLAELGAWATIKSGRTLEQGWGRSFWEFAQRDAELVKRMQAIMDTEEEMGRYARLVLERERAE